MGRLRSWKREHFAGGIAEGKEPKRAYLEAGFKPSSAKFRNYNRLLKEPDVIARVNQYKMERENRARAARVPVDEVLAKLEARGIHHVADFFDRNEAGILAPCDLRQIPVEIAMAFLRLASDALGILIEIKAASRTALLANYKNPSESNEFRGAISHEQAGAIALRLFHVATWTGWTGPDGLPQFKKCPSLLKVRRVGRVGRGIPSPEIKKKLGDRGHYACDACHSTHVTCACQTKMGNGETA